MTLTGKVLTLPVFYCEAKGVDKTIIGYTSSDKGG